MKNGDTLKKLREDNGYTQEQVAAFLEVDQSLIARIEKNERNLNADQLQDLLNLYGVEYFTFTNGCVTTPIAYAYRSKDLTNAELKAVSEINRIILNLEFMEKINAE